MQVLKNIENLPVINVPIDVELWSGKVVDLKEALEPRFSYYIALLDSLINAIKNPFIKTNRNHGNRGQRIAVKPQPAHALSFPGSSTLIGALYDALIISSSCPLLDNTLRGLDRNTILLSLVVL